MQLCGQKIVYYRSDYALLFWNETHVLFSTHSWLSWALVSDAIPSTSQGRRHEVVIGVLLSSIVTITNDQCRRFERRVLGCCVPDGLDGEIPFRRRDADSLTRNRQCSQRLAER